VSCLYFPLLEGRIKRRRVAQIVMTPGAQDVLPSSAEKFKEDEKVVDRTKFECYRVYDADMPEYAVAIDISRLGPNVQEIQASEKVLTRKSQQRSRFEMMSAFHTALNIAESNVNLEAASTQSGKEQYEKLDQSKHENESLKEYGCDFIVNLKDYLTPVLF